VTSADILSFERGCRILRGVDVEADRKARIRALWVEARRRAYNGLVYESDVAMFGLEALKAEMGAYLIRRELQILRHAPAA